MLDRSIVEDQEHEFLEEGWDWTEGFDEPTQVFTSRVSSGQADPELSRLFEGRSKEGGSTSHLGRIARFAEGRM